MPLLRFVILLFVFIGVLASCAVAVALLMLMLRFWPVLIAILLGCGVFGWLLSRAGKYKDRS
ncbi:hypothetical protein AB8Q16_04995 [Pseudomonas aeruginosa]|uniref:hypothetical protein n=1 Tax=Pseudomonas aeruginosa TaxID=287 RepID=UPI00093B38C5|nr:hypothetical protein [Pseudomonas aeruginosa]MCS7901129.1 hypothetical protein [Pseudomonas aeruginosa]OYP28768.1 hypothetical protein CHH44_18225 [Pseudomonas aeruginosa]HEO1594293.1 hypothetical protein [Pseudomonas aeruginosa]